MNIEHISRHWHEKSSGTENFCQKYELVEAEIALVLGDILKAQDYYERAFSGVQ